METHDLQQLIDDTNDEEPVDVSADQAIITALGSDDEARANAAARLFRLGAVGQHALREHTPQIQSTLSDASTIGQKDILHGLARVGESNRAVLHPFVGSLVSKLNAQDPGIRAQAGAVLVLVAEDSPEQLEQHIERVVAAVDDGDQQSVRNKLTILSRLLGGGDSSSDPDISDQARSVITNPGVVDKAVASINEANSGLRAAAVNYLSGACSNDVEVIAEHVDEITGGLSDPDARVRSQTAYILAEIAEQGTELNNRCLSRLTTLLQDPEELARLNSATCFIAVGSETPARLPAESIGEAVPTLLETELVAAQEQAVWLALILARERRATIADQRRVISTLKRLRADELVSVPDEVFARILDVVDSGSNGSSRRSSTAGNSSSSPSKQETERHAPQDSDGGGETKDHAEETDIFGGVSTTLCQSCGADISETDANFCPECGSEI